MGWLGKTNQRLNQSTIQRLFAGLISYVDDKLIRNQPNQQINFSTNQLSGRPEQIWTADPYIISVVL